MLLLVALFLMPGLTDNLLEAQILLDDKLQKLSRTAQKPRWPREWLGKGDAEGIRRLVPSSFVGRHIEGRSFRSRLCFF